jgi:ubiquinone/menaquinone biosynthesis C-methylase UbiE
MIELACKIEQQNPKGFEYIVADIKQLRLPEQLFHLVTGYVLLNYAQTRDNTRYLFAT